MFDEKGCLNLCVCKVKSMRHFLEGRGVNGVIHILDSLFDLELLGVQLVLEFIDGAFQFADLNEKWCQKRF